MLTAAKKLLYWLLSLFISFLPILFLSLSVSINESKAFSDAFYNEFCKPSTIYISLSLLILLLIEHIAFYDNKDLLFKSFYKGWKIGTIVFTICEAFLYGFLSNNTDLSQENDTLMVAFILNLVCIVVSVFIGLVKLVTDIIRERKE